MLKFHHTGCILAVLAIFGQFWVLIKGIPPYILVYFLPRFVLISGGVKNPWKIGENPPIGGKEYTLSYVNTRSLSYLSLEPDFPTQQLREGYLGTYQNLQNLARKGTEIFEKLSVFRMSLKILAYTHHGGAFVTTLFLYFTPFRYLVQKPLFPERFGGRIDLSPFDIIYIFFCDKK